MDSGPTSCIPRKAGYPSTERYGLNTQDQKHDDWGGWAGNLNELVIHHSILCTKSA
jgi:hypothetical protein